MRRIDKGIRNFVDLEGDDTAAESVKVIAEKDELLRTYQAEKEHGVGCWNLFRGRTLDSGPATLRRFLLVVGAQLIVQLNGINATSY